MKQSVSVHDFIDAFRRRGRQNSFSLDGFRALYDYLIEDEENSGIEYEFDPIGLDGDYTEYEDLEEFHENYDKETYPDIESIQHKTIFISVKDDSFIILNF